MKNMVKSKIRVLKAGVMICILLSAFVTSAQTANFENIHVLKIVEEKEKILEDPPEEEWNNSFGGSDYEEGRSVQQTTDGGYIITGRTSSYGAGGYDVWLIKADSNGNKEWDITFGGENDDIGYSVQQTADGGYIITGYTHSFGAGGYDVWLIKTYSNGSMEWNQTFGETNYDEGYCVQQTEDGGYIITGRSSSFSDGDHDLWLIKTDSNGNEEWNKTFGGPLYDYGYSVKQTTDGGYIITGFCGTGHFDVWLIKTDPIGNEEWSNIYGGVASDGGYSVQQTADGGYIVVGYTSSYSSGGSDAWLIKTDSKGDKEWDKTLGGTNSEVGFSVQQTVDEGYIITGQLFTYSTQKYEIWLIKTDSDGNIDWDQTFGVSDLNYGYFVEQTAEGGYIITGSTGSHSEGFDVWLIKIETENYPPYEPSEPIPEDNSIDVNIDTNISWTGGDPENDTTKYDVYFDVVNPPELKVSEDQSETTFDPGTLMFETIYYWKIIAKDEYGAFTPGDVWQFTTRHNTPPNVTTIDGPNRGNPDISYEFGFSCIDSYGDEIGEYIIRWGDDSDEEIIIGPFSSGEEVFANHSWDEKGSYTIQAKAKDVYGAECSSWGSFVISIPRTRTVLNLWYHWFLERFPLLERLLDIIKDKADYKT
jgi:hypothetical protein